MEIQRAENINSSYQIHSWFLEVYFILREREEFSRNMLTPTGIQMQKCGKKEYALSLSLSWLSYSTVGVECFLTMIFSAIFKLFLLVSM